MSKPSTRRAQRGFTLIEVLVALLIFSFGVLGIVGLQARAATFSTQAEDRARAAILANEIVAQMWTQQTLTLDATTVIAPWQTRVSNAAVAGLPGASGTVSAVNATTAAVTITWRPPSMASTDTPYQFVTKVSMP